MIIQVGENSVAFTAALERTSDCVRRVRALQHMIQRDRYPGLVSMHPGLDTLIVRFQEITDPLIRDLETLAGELENQVLPDWTSSPLVQIPVCYEMEFGSDLAIVSEKTGLSSEEIVALHSSTVYEVWMLGFMPGFPYLGELPELLHISRKKAPDPSVLAGSVAIAEEYTGIYPLKSPGGWHIIGRTPISILDYSRVKPWLLDYGARVQFFPISLTEFNLRRGKNEASHH